MRLRTGRKRRSVTRHGRRPVPRRAGADRCSYSSEVVALTSVKSRPSHGYSGFAIPYLLFLRQVHRLGGRRRMLSPLAMSGPNPPISQRPGSARSLESAPLARGRHHAQRSLRRGTLRPSPPAGCRIHDTTRRRRRSFPTRSPATTPCPRRSRQKSLDHRAEGPEPSAHSCRPGTGPPIGAARKPAPPAAQPAITSVAGVTDANGRTDVQGSHTNPRGSE
jgi:hypothetical protein